MDIAEIRKKAKEQSAKASSPGEDESVGVDAPAEEEEAASQVPADEPIGSELAPTVTGDDSAEAEMADGLERLFASTEELVLATDESYSEMLDEAADDQARDICQYLAFHLDDEEYALDIRLISEIIKVRNFTDIPRAPEFILGIISLRGVVVPVFDLRLRLKLGRSELLPTSRIIVCQLDDLTVGLLVDSINQVVNLVDDEIEPPPGVLSGLDREMVSGIGRFQGRMIILLEIASVLDVEMT